MIFEHIPSLLLISALAVDLIFGELPNAIHPVLWMGSYIKFFWHRRFKNNPLILFLCGFFIVLSGAFLFSFGSSVLINKTPFWISLLISAFLLTTVFSFRALISAGRQVRAALEQSDLKKARELTAWHLVSRNTDSLSEEEIVSAVIESLSENITDSFTSPLFFFALGGIPASLFYRFVNTSDSLIAYRKGDYEWGGKATAWLDTILNWIPSRISGLLIVLSAFLTGEDWKSSWSSMISEHKKTSSPNAGWTMAAIAGALNITLEKHGDYCILGGRREREFQLIDRAVKIVIVTMIIVVFLSILLLEVIH